MGTIKPEPFEKIEQTFRFYEKDGRGFKLYTPFCPKEKLNMDTSRSRLYRGVYPVIMSLNRESNNDTSTTLNLLSKKTLLDLFRICHRELAYGATTPEEIIKIVLLIQKMSIMSNEIKGTNSKKFLITIGVNEVLLSYNEELRLLNETSLWGYLENISKQDLLERTKFTLTTEEYTESIITEVVDSIIGITLHLNQERILNG